MNKQSANSETSAGKQPLAALLALHGTASSANQWQKLREACTGYRTVISPELPGYGTTRNAQRPGLEARLQPLLRGFQSLDTPVHLVGHSFGGALALRLAEMHPERVRSVTIYEPTSLGVFRGAVLENDRRLLQKMQLLASRVTDTAPHQSMGYFIDFWMGDGQWDKLGQQARQSLASYSSIAAQDFQDGLHEASVAPVYPPFPGPVTLLCGDATVDVARRVCERLAESLPDAKLKLLPGLGHMGPLQNAETVNADILEHIAGVEGAALSP